MFNHYRNKCQECQRMFLAELDDDGIEVSSNLCYDCFEASLEEYEERRREKIAERNEY